MVAMMTCLHAARKARLTIRQSPTTSPSAACRKTAELHDSPAAFARQLAKPRSRHLSTTAKNNFTVGGNRQLPGFFAQAFSVAVGDEWRLDRKTESQGWREIIERKNSKSRGGHAICHLVVDASLERYIYLFARGNG